MKCIIGCIYIAAIVLHQAQPPAADDSSIRTLINVGAVGACLVLLGIWHIRKDAKAEARMDERIKQEQEFRKEMNALHEQYRKELVELNEKTRTTMEKVNQTLESMIRMLMTKRGKGGGDE